MSTISRGTFINRVRDQRLTIPRERGETKGARALWEAARLADTEGQRGVIDTLKEWNDLFTFLENTERNDDDYLLEPAIYRVTYDALEELDRKLSIGVPGGAFIPADLQRPPVVAREEPGYRPADGAVGAVSDHFRPDTRPQWWQKVIDTLIELFSGDFFVPNINIVTTETYDRDIIIRDKAPGVWGQFSAQEKFDLRQMFETEWGDEDKRRYYVEDLARALKRRFTFYDTDEQALWDAEQMLLALRDVALADSDASTPPPPTSPTDDVDGATTPSRSPVTDRYVADAVERDASVATARAEVDAAVRRGAELLATNGRVPLDLKLDASLPERRVSITAVVRGLFGGNGERQRILREQAREYIEEAVQREEAVRLRVEKDIREQLGELRYRKQAIATYEGVVREAKRIRTRAAEPVIAQVRQDAAARRSPAFSDHSGAPTEREIRAEIYRRLRTNQQWLSADRAVTGAENALDQANRAYETYQTKLMRDLGFTKPQLDEMAAENPLRTGPITTSDEEIGHRLAASPILEAQRAALRRAGFEEDLILLTQRTALDIELTADPVSGAVSAALSLLLQRLDRRGVEASAARARADVEVAARKYYEAYFGLRSRALDLRDQINEKLTQEGEKQEQIDQAERQIRGLLGNTSGGDVADRSILNYVSGLRRDIERWRRELLDLQRQRAALEAEYDMLIR